MFPSRRVCLLLKSSGIGNLQMPGCKRIWARYSVRSGASNQDLECAIKAKKVKSPKNMQYTLRYLRRSSISNSIGRANTNIKDGVMQKLISSSEVRLCTSITTAEKYVLPKCMHLLRQQGLQPSELIPDETVTFRFTSDKDVAEIMIMGQNGSVVGWGIDESTLASRILPLIADARINPLPQEDYESEDIDYIEITQDTAALPAEILNGSSFLSDDIIVIKSLDPNLGLLDKAAFSSGISRSTRLAVLESAMEKHISNTRIVTEKVSKGLQLTLTERDFLKYIGRLFLIRGKLNLYSGLVETPDLYWTEPQLEQLFKDVSKYLDITPRINILNSKLNYSLSECQAFLAVMHERKSTFLEWIIIYLIAFELCFELYHFYERFYLKDPPSSESERAVQ